MSVTDKKEVKYLIHLLACAFSGKAPSVIDGVDYKKLLSIAGRHQVYNIIFPLITDLEGVPEKEKAEFRDSSLSELKRMLVMNNERSMIFEQLKENGIRFMPLKGLILKAYYPKESMRQMSDNDILFDEENRDSVARIMKQNGYRVLATGENSDDYHKEPYSTFEFHRTLFFEENDFCPRFDFVWNNAVKDEENPCLYRMSLNDTYIYNVCHMFKHYSSGGCGIRFLCDNYLFLKKENEKLDFDYINSKLASFGIAEFEKQTRELAFKLFDEKELSGDDENLLDDFINSGIFGTSKARLEKEFEATDGSLESAKQRYILKRLFPPKKKMIADYRALEKRPYLLPLYYIYRFFRGAAHSKETVNEIKDINSIK
ncbi:MAG: nucleotidyltransferase family protein [Eubacterium sp.]|nr:nucleotidyltransferase family protein [Eubacterium sp.]